MEILQRGSRGESVARLQALLCRSGIDVTPIDGDFGGVTARGVEALQKKNRLPTTGVADFDTQKSVGMDKPDETKTLVPVVDRVTVDKVVAMFSHSTPRRNIKTYLPYILAAFKKHAMDDRDLLLMGLGTIAAETARFEPISEKQSQYNTEPGQHAFNLYDSRSDLGNQGRPDGDRFKGRGFIQLTGRSNYRRYGERLGLGNDLIENPEKANDPQIAAELLALFIKDKQPRVKYAILGGDLTYARKLVNGGSHGLDNFTTSFNAGVQQFA